MKTVLIADDELIARKMLTESIDWNKYGYQISHEVANGKEALEYVVQNNPDVVFADIKMPVMDGLELLKQANSIGVRSKFIMLTCYEDFNYVRDALRYGAIDYLVKHTFEPQDLIDLLSRITGMLSKDEMYWKGIGLIEEEVLNKLIKKELAECEIKNYVDSGVLPFRLPKYIMSGFFFQENIIEEQKQKLRSVLIEKLNSAVDNKPIVSVYYFNVNRDNNVYAIFFINDYSSASEAKNKIREIVAKLYKDSNICDFGWMTNVTYHIYTGWENLANAYSELQTNNEPYCQYYRCSSKVIRAIEYVRENYSRQFTLEDIADYVGVTRVYLSQIFKKETGTNIYEFIRDYRLNVAKKLLLSSNLKSYTISEVCGFGSAQYFNKVFKKIMGFSPIQYKENNID
jgi:two-component system response regulator YesN